MTSRVKALLLSVPAFGLLAACNLPPKLEDAQYWQRKNTTSALYLRGPKAQQTLHSDIANCVTEIDELERLGPLREAIPADKQPSQPTSESNRYRSDNWESNAVSQKLDRWDTPKRDGYLYAEHFNYNDFEGCMDYKGWERVENLPYERIKISRDDYLESVYGNQYQSRNPHLQRETKTDPYASSPGQTVNK